MYSGDNNDKLVRVGGLAELVIDPADPSAQPGGAKSQWALGRVDQMPFRTNTTLLKGGLLYPYVNSLGVYKCPADNTQIGGGVSVRSMSMNCWMNPIDSWNDYGGNHPGKVREFRRQGNIMAPTPSMAFVFIDENPWGIDDGFFVCDPLKPVWIRIPASYHNGAGGLSFAHQDHRQRLPPDHPCDVAGRCAQGHADADLAAALRHGIRQQPVDPHGSEHGRQQSPGTRLRTPAP